MNKVSELVYEVLTISEDLDRCKRSTHILSHHNEWKSLESAPLISQDTRDTFATEMGQWRCSVKCSNFNGQDLPANIPELRPVHLDERSHHCTTSMQTQSIPWISHTLAKTSPNRLNYHLHVWLSLLKFRFWNEELIPVS